MSNKKLEYIISIGRGLTVRLECFEHQQQSLTYVHVSLCMWLPNVTPKFLGECKNVFVEAARGS